MPTGFKSILSVKLALFIERTKTTQLSRLTQAAPKEKWATPSGDFSFYSFVMQLICVVANCNAVVAVRSVRLRRHFVRVSHLSCLPKALNRTEF